MKCSVAKVVRRTTQPCSHHNRSTADFIVDLENKWLRNASYQNEPYKRKYGEKQENTGYLWVSVLYAVYAIPYNQSIWVSHTPLLPTIGLSASFTRVRLCRSGLLLAVPGSHYC